MGLIFAARMSNYGLKTTVNPQFWGLRADFSRENSNKFTIDNFNKTLIGRVEAYIFTP